MRIPGKGIPKEELFQRMEAYGTHDLQTHGGRTWAYVYDSGQARVEETAREAYLKFLSPNGLDPTVFPSLLRFENELVAMAAAHLNGGDEAVGSFTSGGTESCMLAVKTARDRFRELKPEIREPEMVLPVTAHAAFHKAAGYFCVKPVLTPVDPRTFKADVKAMEEAITDNTVLLVGSAVSYAHGVVDPIREMGRLALDKGLPLHVDGCVGAWMLPYFRRLGAPIPDFDFSVPGVSSISMDFHKYAYCPKGASVIMYKNKELRRHQFFACANWTGYTVINATIQSSKTGGPLAAAWATLNSYGDEGYLEIAKRTYEATQKVIQGIKAIPELRILGEPEFSMVAFTSDQVSVFELIDEMKEKAWYIQPQLGFHGSKENIHLSITGISLDRVDEMLADLRDCVARVKEAGSGREEPPLMQALTGMDLSSLDPEALNQLLAMAGISGGSLPGRMAGINNILNALPPALTEKLLIAYFNELFLYQPE